MDPDRDELRKMLKAKGGKTLEDFNAFMRDISKDVVETLLEGELTDHLGYEKQDQKAKVTENTRNGFYSQDGQIQIWRDRVGGSSG